MDVFGTFLRHWLPRPSSVLEVGAGTGGLAAELARWGHQVTAIDPHGRPGTGVLPVGIERFRISEPFDAVVAQRSLHHVQDVGRAVEIIASALQPGGVLVLHEFCWDRLDAATARWLHGRLEVRGDAPCHDADEFLAWWRAEHQGLATEEELREHLDNHFDRLAQEWVPYLADEWLGGRDQDRRSETTELQRGAIQPVSYVYAGRVRPVSCGADV